MKSVLSKEEARRSQDVILNDSEQNLSLYKRFSDAIDHNHQARFGTGMVSVLDSIGVDMFIELDNLFRFLKHDDTVRIRDLGCGPAGLAVEELVRLCISYRHMKGVRAQVDAAGIDLAPGSLESVPEKIFNTLEELDERILNDEEREVLAQQQGTRKRISRLLEGNVCELPDADNSVDIITGMAVVPFVGDPLKMLEEVYRVLKPGGVAGIEGQFHLFVEEPKFEEILNARFGRLPVYKRPFNFTKGNKDTGFISGVRVKKGFGENFEGFEYELKTVLNYEEIVARKAKRGKQYPPQSRPQKDFFRWAVYEKK